MMAARFNSKVPSRVAQKVMPGPFLEFRQAIFAANDQVQSPLPLAFMSALAGAATAVQGLIDVKCPGAGISPVSLFLLACAESGERKTATDKLLMQPISEMERTLETQAQDAAVQYHVEQQLWQAKQTALARKLSKAIASEEDCTAIADELRRHHTTQPVARKMPQFLFEDTTTPGLLQKMHAGSSNATLTSNEGGIIFNRTGISDLPYVNKLWDGADINITRASKPSFKIHDARLSISIMLQPELLDRFSKRTNGIARTSGFFARCLPIHPESTQGTRFQGNSSNQYWQNDQYLGWYRKRIKGFLQETLENQGSPRKIVVFNPEASQIWRNFYNQVEANLKTNGFLSDIRDFASKIANNMSRIAAVLHYFCGYGDEINATTAAFARDISMSFLLEFKRMFGIKTEEMIAEENALALLDFMRKKGYPLQTTWIMQYGPAVLRNKAALDAAISILIQRNLMHFTVAITSKEKREIYLDHSQLNQLNFYPRQWPSPNWATTLGEREISPF